MYIPEKLNPNYRPITNFVRFVETDESQHKEKLFRLAVDIGNCLWKVKSKPGKIIFRRLKKFFLKSNWFKKVRIIRDKIYLFRRKGRFAIILGRMDIYLLKIFAKEMRQLSVQ